MAVDLLLPDLSTLVFGKDTALIYLRVGILALE